MLFEPQNLFWYLQRFSRADETWHNYEKGQVNKHFCHCKPSSPQNCDPCKKRKKIPYPLHPLLEHVKVLWQEFMPFYSEAKIYVPENFT